MLGGGPDRVPDGRRPSQLTLVARLFAVPISCGPLKTKRSIESYLMIDHRAGDPGPAMNDGKNNGLRRGLYESAVLTCVHCQRQIVLRPERTRARNWCWKCDKYECDWCASTTRLFGCPGPFTALLDRLQAKAIAKKAAILL